MNIYDDDEVLRRRIHSNVTEVTMILATSDEQKDELKEALSDIVASILDLVRREAIMRRP